MTRQQIAEMIKGIGLPFAYYQFPKDTAQAPPFIVFFYSSSSDLYADQTNYQKITTLNVELYTDDKDFAIEALIEKALNDSGLSYYKEENFLDSERMWQTAYEMEVILT